MTPPVQPPVETSRQSTRCHTMSGAHDEVLAIPDNPSTAEAAMRHERKSAGRGCSSAVNFAGVAWSSAMWLSGR